MFAPWVMALLLVGAEPAGLLGPDLRTAIEQGRWAEAIPALEAALRRNPEAAALRYLLGEGLAQRAELDRAATEVRIALDLRPDRARWWHTLARIEADRGRFREALAALGRAEHIAPSTRIDFDSATCLESAGDLVQALERLERVLTNEPDHVPALRLASTLARDLGRAAEAAELARRALELRPGAPRAAALLGQALLDLDEAEHAAEAERLFVLALAAAPSLPAAHTGLLRCRRLQGLDASAILQGLRTIDRERERLEELRAGLALVPTDIAPRRELAALALRAGDAAEAVRQLRIAQVLAARSEAADQIARELQEATELAKRWGD